MVRTVGSVATRTESLVPCCLRIRCSAVALAAVLVTGCGDMAAPPANRAPTAVGAIPDQILHVPPARVSVAPDTETAGLA